MAGHRNGPGKVRNLRSKPLFDQSRDDYDNGIRHWLEERDEDLRDADPRQLATTLGVWARVVVLILALVGVFYIAASIYQRQIPIVGHLPYLIPPTPSSLPTRSPVP